MQDVRVLFGEHEHFGPFVRLHLIVDDYRKKGIGLFLSVHSESHFFGLHLVLTQFPVEKLHSGKSDVFSVAPVSD